MQEAIYTLDRTHTPASSDPFVLVWRRRLAFCAKLPVTHVHTEYHLCVAKPLREVLRSSGIQCMMHT
jgi:hypothetical protein